VASQNLLSQFELTPRELKVLALIAAGQSTKEVAHTLGISFKTAASHRWRILSKLNAHNTADLTRHAIGIGLVAPHQNGRSTFVCTCVRRQELVVAVQHHLRTLGELAHAEAEAVTSGNENLRMVLDKQIMAELREKDRLLDLLQRHREDHSC
jgi:DNA-binding CsgD family transcriptional regulator